MGINEENENGNGSSMVTDVSDSVERGRGERGRKVKSYLRSGNNSSPVKDGDLWRRNCIGINYCRQALCRVESRE